MLRRVRVLRARKSRPPWARKTRSEGDQFKRGSGMNAAVDEANPAVGGFGHLLAVGDEDDGGFFLPGEGSEEIDDDGAGGGVEIAGGLVGEENGGAVHEGAGESGTLELAAGELVGAVMGAVGQTDGLEEAVGADFAGGVGAAGEEKGKEDVLFHGQGGEEVEELEDEADFELAQAGEGVVVHGVEGQAFEVDLAGGGGVERAEDVKEGAFPAATGSGDGHDLARENFEGNASEGLHPCIAGLVGFVEITRFEHKKAGLGDR
jgi:hypothetical protein